MSDYAFGDRRNKKKDKKREKKKHPYKKGGFLRSSNLSSKND
jgi:hypothetical protein